MRNTGDATFKHKRQPRSSHFHFHTHSINTTITHSQNLHNVLNKCVGCLLFLERVAECTQDALIAANRLQTRKLHVLLCPLPQSQLRYTPARIIGKTARKQQEYFCGFPQKCDQEGIASNRKKRKHEHRFAVYIPQAKTP